jgi:hypothetical protein
MAGQTAPWQGEDDEKMMAGENLPLALFGRIR